MKSMSTTYGTLPTYTAFAECWDNVIGEDDCYTTYGVPGLDDGEHTIDDIWDFIVLAVCDNNGRTDEPRELPSGEPDPDDEIAVNLDTASSILYTLGIEWV